MAIYEFGPFRLDPAERLLLRGRQPIPLKPKAFDLLVLLVERHGRLLTKQELMDAVWPATSVEEGNLTHTISTLRKALGDGQDGGQFIETVPTRGYRFVSAVREHSVAPAAPPIASTSAAPGSGRRTPMRPMAFALLAVVVAGGAIWWRMGRAKGSAISADQILTRLTADASLTAYPAISQDGARVAYASDRGGENLDIWVQQIAGGDAIKVTQDPADDYEPAFSPDGTRIAFRSNRQGGGIYMVSALGGESKLVVPDGRRPRFSPDGKWLAYWVGHEHLLGQTYVLPVAGGQPRKITVPVVAEEQPWNVIVDGPPGETRSPVWLPDGKRLLVVGGADWWIASLDGSPAIKTGAADILRSAELRTPADDVSAPLLVPEAWRDSGGGEVIVSAVSGDSRNLWRLAVNPETGLAAGPPQRFTFGTEWELQASNSGGVRTTFASISRSSNLWWLSVETNTARVTGDLHRMTQEGRHLIRPDISLDGRILVYADEGSKGALRLRHLDDGSETNALDSDENRYSPALTLDGSRVLYAAGVVLGRLDGRSPADFSLHTISASGGVPTTICEACGPEIPYGAYSPTGDRVAYTTRDSVMQFDVSTGRAQRVAGRERSFPRLGALRVFDMRYSPDGRWLAFHGLNAYRRRIFVIDTTRTDGKDPDWIPATTEPAMSDSRAAWSPDGNLLYFVSDRDGFRCIWAQRLEPETKQPLERPFAVYHLHQTSRRIHHNAGRVGLAVARDKIVVALEELRGNVWMLEPRVSASGHSAQH